MTEVMFCFLASAMIRSRQGFNALQDSIMRPPPTWRLLPWGAGMPMVFHEYDWFITALGSVVWPAMRIRLAA